MKRFIKVTCLLLPVLLVMLLVPTRSSEDLIRIRDFYREEENSLDVVFVGASEVFAGVSSALAYGEYGYTSYPYCLSSNYPDLYRVQLEEIRRTQDPKLIVLDISGAVRPDVPENADAILRTYLEEMPLSVNKLRTVWELGDHEQLPSYFVPFMMHHGSADVRQTLSMVKDDFRAVQRGYGYLKGTITCTTQNLPGELISLTSEDMAKKAPLPGEAEPKLREFLEYCRENGYDNILFAAFPHRIASDYACYRIQLFNTARELIESYGYDFVNLEAASDAMGIDQNRDYYNDEHLNIYGQQKLTRYLSELLVREYGLGESRLTPENKARWDNSFDYIRKFYAYTEKLTQEQPGVEHWIWEEDWRIEEIGNMRLESGKG